MSIYSSHDANMTLACEHFGIRGVLLYRDQRERTFVHTAQRGQTIVPYRPRRRLLRPTNVLAGPDDGPLTTRDAHCTCIATCTAGHESVGNGQRYGRHGHRIAPTAPADRSIVFGKRASPATDLHPRTARRFGRHTIVQHEPAIVQSSHAIGRAGHRSVRLVQSVRPSRTATHAPKSRRPASMIHRPAPHAKTNRHQQPAHCTARHRR